MRRDQLFTLRLHVEMVLSAIFQESNILKYINNKYALPRKKEGMQIFIPFTHYCYNKHDKSICYYKIVSGKK